MLSMTCVRASLTTLLFSAHGLANVGNFTTILPSFYHVKILLIKKPTVTGWFLYRILVGMRGFEPPTPDTP